MANNVNNLQKYKCTGCSACLNACPKDAIRMVPNDKGFYIPTISLRKCVDCGLCVKACPVLTRPSMGDPEPAAVAVKSEPEIFKKSTSAGVSALMAEYFLSIGGYVCGAAYDEEFKVKHILVNNEKGANRIKKSKYIQSEIGLTFRKIKELLDADTPVLFTGTPCQVAGLKGYLKKDYENLLTMDLICHGVPSPGVWKKYLDENIDEILNLSDVDFRLKDGQGWKNYRMAFSYRNTKQISESPNKNAYYLQFLRNLGLRDTCYECPFSECPRVGDISMGDWWGVIDIAPELIADDKGLSAVLLNNEKGKRYFEKISDRFTVKHEMTVKEAFTKNRYNSKISKHPDRDGFFNRLKTMSVEEAVDRTLNPHYDVMVVGSTLNTNYGALATYYALYKTVESLGYKTVMINLPQYLKSDDHATRFAAEHIELAPMKTIGDYESLNSMADIFLLGSDQVWNYFLFKGYRNRLYLDFVSDDKKKIAYAASYGLAYPTVIDKNMFNFPATFKSIKRIDDIAVRENDAVGITKDFYDSKATFVCDPVFLMDIKEYNALADSAPRKPESGYITSYFLAPTEQRNNVLSFVAEDRKLPMVNMITGNLKRYEEYLPMAIPPVVEGLTLPEWLYNIKNADYVVTDSYHALCFSIIFRKKFVLIKSGWASSRITSLLSKLGLEKRAVKSVDELKKCPEIITADIDYDKVHKILDQMKAESLGWLKRALEAKKKTEIVASVNADELSRKDKVFAGAKDLDSYLKAMDKNLSKHTYMVISNGLSSEEIEALKDKGVFEKAEVCAGRNFIKGTATPWFMKGTGAENCCSDKILISEYGIAEMKKLAGKPCYISFDWQTSANSGEFKIRLSAAPWTTIVNPITVTMDKRNGHFEGYFIVSDKIKEFEDDGITIRTDNLKGDLSISNLIINSGLNPVPWSPAPEDGKKLTAKPAGFCAIIDKKYAKKSLAALSNLVYEGKDARFSIGGFDKGVGGEQFKTPFAEAYIEGGNKKQIVSLAKKGLYIIAWSKASEKIVDIASVDVEAEFKVKHL